MMDDYGGNIVGRRWRTTMATKGKKRRVFLFFFPVIYFFRFLLPYRTTEDDDDDDVEEFLIMRFSVFLFLFRVVVYDD